ncbi:uncharacterized protein LOC112573855 [Pomacea canaliculata]|uniref:uncharacterized protein LOC112573855 n=1 Tax=Pomacea canaliculata TaxID=400727 RepID=UPI000D72D89F|nr:uncharacterized protein LOC112573855 [Pomacea canaliculata]
MYVSMMLIFLLLGMAVADSNEDDTGCTPLGRHCIATATCDNGTCVCPAHQHGDGTFVCIDRDRALCTVDADPHLLTYSGEDVDVSLPCTYLVAHFDIGLDPPARNATHLNIKVYAQNVLTNEGFFFVDKLKVRVTLKHLPTKGEAELVEETHKIIVSGRDILQVISGAKTNPWKFPSSTIFRDLNFVFDWDEQNQFAILSLPRGGPTIKFRAYDREHQPQILKPGIIIESSKTSDIYNADMGVCLSPRRPGLLQHLANNLHLKSPSLMFIYKVLTDNDAPETWNNRRRRCKAARRLIASCNTSAIVAINTCGPMLQQTSLIRALAELEVRVMRAFLNCLAWVCGKEVKSCRWMTQILTQDMIHLPRRARMLACALGKLYAAPPASINRHTASTDHRGPPEPGTWSRSHVSPEKLTTFYVPVA